MWIINGAHNATQITSTLTHQHCPSPDFKQDTNLHQANQHINVVIFYHVTLSKTQKLTQFIGLLRVRKTSTQTRLLKSERMFKTKPFCQELCLKKSAMSAVASRVPKNRSVRTHFAFFRNWNS